MHVHNRLPLIDNRILSTSTASPMRQEAQKGHFFRVETIISVQKKQPDFGDRENNEKTILSRGAKL